MTDFRWFRLLIFALGLYFAGVAIAEMVYYATWAAREFTRSASSYRGEMSELAMVLLFNYAAPALRLAFGIYLMRGGGALTKWILERVQHNCARCDYPLLEVKDKKCPECGLEFERTNSDIKVDSPSVS